MANTSTIATADLGTDTAREAFGTVRTYLTLFGAASAIVLATVAVMAFTHHEATSFMWVRGVIMIAVSRLFLRTARKAAEGSRNAFDRLRTMTVVTPIAVIAVDLVPGLCPAWYAVLQGLSALALVGAAVLTRGPALRAAFPAK